MMASAGETCKYVFIYLHIKLVKLEGITVNQNCKPTFTLFCLCS
jgi:hypothetical protein